jgi:hypothetical protein
MSDIWVSPIPNDKMNYSWAIFIMILDGVIYGILGWYVKKVFPSRYGASQPWYFIFTPKFWGSTIFCRMFCRNRQQAKLDEYLKDKTFKVKKNKSII